jgi:outer membrane murein-binding lipoprotein Lpp
MKHQETHPNLDVEGCFACRISHVTMSGAAMPTRRNVSTLNAKERQLDKDLDAYKRIRKTGGQPTQIDGAARLEATAN